MPLYATPFTAGLIAGKLEEEGLTGAGQAQHHRARRQRSTSARSASAIVPLAHSIPEGNGAADRNAVRQHLPHRRLEDRRDAGARRAPSTETLTADRRRGVLALVCDSTNVFQDKPSGSEDGVHAGLLDAGRRGARGGCWSPPSPPTPRGSRPSAASRSETGRQVCVAGRSLDRILRVAKATGYLHGFPASRSASTRRCGCRGARC